MKQFVLFCFLFVPMTILAQKQYLLAAEDAKACGGKKTQVESVDTAVSDSTEVKAKEEIVGIINELYAAAARNEGDIDGRFACHAWRDTVAAVEAKDAHVEEIGFFNDDYWTEMQDANPDDLEARDIQFEQLDVEKGRAAVSFILHSSVQTIHMKFIFCREDGGWRVHDIIRFYDDQDGKESSFSFMDSMQEFLNEPGATATETQSTQQDDMDDKYATELVKVGTAAPDFKMKTPDGKTIQLSEYAKGKTVVLDFWASWCPDCRKDAPEVVRLYEKYRQYGIEFIGISMDTDVEAWKKAIEKFAITYPQVSELKKFKETDIAKAYGVKWIPSMVVVGPDGEVKLSTVLTYKVDKYLKELTTVAP